MGKEEEKLTRTVIDTNAFISSVLFRSQADDLVKCWQRRKFIFLVSKPIVDEYIKVLTYPKFKLNKDEIKHILEYELLKFVEIIEVKSELSVIKEEPSDNIFLSTAIDGEADIIVSGDKHLLSLGKFKNIEIVKLRKFFNLLAK